MTGLGLLNTLCTRKAGTKHPLNSVSSLGLYQAACSPVRSRQFLAWRASVLATPQCEARLCSPGGVDRASAPACPLGPPPTLVAGPWAARKAHHSLRTADLAVLHGIFTSSHLLPLEPESSKAVTLKSASLGALHAVDSSCSPSAQAHLQRLLKQQAPHCPQLC